MRWILTSIIAGGLVINVAASAQAGTIAKPARPTTTTKACEAASIALPADTTIDNMQVISAPVAYCRYDGYVTTHNPGPNKVRFMVALPARWNGRFLFTAPGGAGGFIADPEDSYLGEGYALATTDKGVVTSGILDFSFRSNPAMDLDWTHRGVHVAAVATQSITRTFYDAGQMPRYVAGCSGGGASVLSEAELYPADFDGYIAGATMTDWPYTPALNFAAIAQRVGRDPSAWISPADYERIYKVLLARHDRDDGAIDELIWDPRTIQLDADDRKALDFLSDTQFETLRMITAGVRAADGRVLSPGFLLGNPSNYGRFLTGNTPPPWGTFRQYPNGYMIATTNMYPMPPKEANFSYITGPDLFHLTGEPPFMQPTVYDHRRLSGLRATGGKLILWTGSAEEAVPPLHTLGYVERADQTFGKARPSFMRAFLIPGLHHCRLGEGAPTNSPKAMLEAAQDWVERNQAPGHVLLDNRPLVTPTAGPAVRAEALRTYKVCSYPARAVFKGGLANRNRLDVRDARNWVCRL